MTFELEVKAVAIEQAAEAYEYYERQQAGLGERFLVMLSESYEGLRQSPWFEMRKPPFRYVMLRKFPYRVVYVVEGSKVIIYQIRHTSRKPSGKYGP